MIETIPTILDTKETDSRLTGSSTVDRTNQILKVDEFIESLQNIDNLDDFAEFRSMFSNFMKELCSASLEGKSESFILSFEQGSVSKYQSSVDEDTEEMKQLLRSLLLKKSAIYKEVLLKIISLGKLDTLLTPEEKLDIENIIKSNILNFFDDLISPWLLSATNPDNKELGLKLENPQYGGVQDRQLVGFGAFTSERIDTDRLKAISNPHIGAYLLRISELLANGVYDYGAWVEAEMHESMVWKDQTKRIGFVSPMEDYIAPGLLVEPELYLFLKDTRNQVQYSEFYDLSARYFDQRFGMDHMTCTHVETLLEGGDAIFGQFIGKAFPNDRELSESHGNNIILRSSPMTLVVQNAMKQMPLLFPGTKIDADELKKELLKEVTYHEFGHSLFVKGHPSSLLEEAKASLFYYLELFDDNKTEQYAENDIERIILFVVMDSIRMIERLGQSQYAKYAILMQSVLTPLFTTGLVQITESGLEMDLNPQKFGVFLQTLRDLLFRIQELYTLDIYELSQEEKLILDGLEKDSEPYIQYIAQRIGIDIHSPK